MGLDSIELLVEIEKIFGISIPHQEAEKILTVADFHNAVWKHVAGKESARCKSQAIYYQLRRSFAAAFDAPFPLEAVPNKIFPEANRKLVYASFGNAVHLELPRMALNKPGALLLDIVGWTSIGGGLVCSLVLINGFDYSKWTLLIPIAGIFLTGLCSDLLKPLRTIIKEPTVRAFVQQVLYLNYSKMAQEQGVTRKEVEMIINQTITDKMGVEPEEVVPEAKLGDDLGIN